MRFSPIFFAALAPAAVVAGVIKNNDAHGNNVCVVTANGDGDSAPAIVEAFEKCGHNPSNRRGKVVFQNETYNIKSVMRTLDLSNVDIDHRGTLLVGATSVFCSLRG